MTLTTLARAALLGAGIALAMPPAFAAGTANKPHVPLEKTIGHPTHVAPVPSLAVLNADGATLADGKLTLTGVSGNTIVFADRPVRAAGHETTDLFIKRWDEGKDSFAKDPPNATVSVLGGDTSGVADAVVELSKPTLDGSTLTFDVKVLEGDLAGARGPAALFIDWFAVGAGGGVWVGRGHHAWYGVAPVVPVAPYYPPRACGYYPYPPCY